jgi:hypothetical protein
MRDDAPVDPPVLMRPAEEGLGLADAPVVAEGSHKGGSRECSARMIGDRPMRRDHAVPPSVGRRPLSHDRGRK